MGATAKFDDGRLWDALVRGVDVGLVSVTVRLGQVVKEMLSRPGSGRVYARRGEARKALGQRGFLSRAEASAFLRSRRTSGLRNMSLRRLGFHKASAPGEPPAADTGDLRRSWQAGFRAPRPVQSGQSRRIVVGSNKRYARRLEFGGGAIAARPYLRPSCDIVRPDASAVVNRAVALALAKAGIGRKR